MSIDYSSKKSSKNDSATTFQDSMASFASFANATISEDNFKDGKDFFGDFGDMADDDEVYEEIIIESDDEDDNYSEHTIDEEEYEAYLATLGQHQMENYEEWRISHLNPQHSAQHNDGGEDDDESEYDEITVNSEEYAEYLAQGGEAMSVATDWEGKDVEVVDGKPKKKKKIKKKRDKKKKKHHKSSKTDKGDHAPVPPQRVASNTSDDIFLVDLLEFR